MEDTTSHYDNLQVKDNASQEVIKGAYRYLSQKWHPDKNPHNKADAERILKIINQAYGVLSDPEKRRAHDDWIKKRRENAEVQFKQPTSPPVASRSPKSSPPPTPSSTQQSRARQPQGGSALGYVKKIAKTAGFFALLVITGIAAKVGVGVSSRSSQQEGSSRTISEDTLNFLAELNAFKVDSNRRASVIKNNYKVGLEASGWPTLFDANRIAGDRDLVNSKKIISLAKAALESYGQSTLTYRKMNKSNIKLMSISENEKHTMLSSFERGSRLDDRLIALEGETFSEAEKVIQLLAKSKGWSVVDDQIVFAKADELGLADSYFKKMSEIHQEQQSIQVEISSSQSAKKAYLTAPQMSPEGVSVAAGASASSRPEPIPEQWKTYSTNGDVKAQGLKISFKYPMNWAGEDGGRAHTLYQIGSDDGHGMDACNLQVRSMSLTQVEVKELFEPRSLYKFLPTSGAEFIDGGRTTVDGKPGAWINFWKKMNMGGVTVQTASIMFPIYYKEKLVVLGCHVGVAEYASRDVVGEAFSEKLRLFQQIANSLIIHNRSESTD